MSGKAIVGRLLSAFAIAMAAETVALACSPGDGEYDKNPEKALVVRALVTSFDRKVTAGQICFNAT